MKRQNGFSLIELMVTVTILGLLLAASAPALSSWIANARVRNAADSLQTALRIAQADAQRRYRQTVVFKTDGACNLAARASGTGRFWVAKTVPLTATDSPEVIQCGPLTDASSGVILTGANAVCFESTGRRVALTGAENLTNADCVPGAARYDITGSAAADRPLAVYVTLAGNVRMCDPLKAYPASPEGCP